MALHQSPASYSDPKMRPPCAKCNTTTMLTRIVPESPGYDRRTFECPKCEHSESMVFKYK
jgi:hypothetical protein